MSAFYNDDEPFAASWLRNLIARDLIAPGVVDTRSITEVTSNDVRHHTQARFFAGIGGWSYALRPAGRPDDALVWTESCPCQPLGKHLGKRDLFGAACDRFYTCRG
jgi:DNA (cytosine-5)-methyltransferase 1